MTPTSSQPPSVTNTVVGEWTSTTAPVMFTTTMTAAMVVANPTISAAPPRSSMVIAVAATAAGAGTPIWVKAVTTSLNPVAFCAP
ncbi:hypothetical protein Ae717Ps2_6120 [Pseudonocardia sp. Ae717_Ps2]|nr:hypothetical protein Ae717Ps2_6810 [Pseudonocardia sp. Ae717_Ps2]OLM28801.1 hypothetical protein Ae717Ps2_6120 [Pseudonocardia sp. Ae717_Ps2]